MERAQLPFMAAGLDVPWYISRGNHDGLIQGNAPASTDLFRAIAIGCLKVFPNAASTRGFAGESADELFAAFSDPTSSRRCSPAARPSRRTRTAGSSPSPSTARCVGNPKRTASATRRRPSCASAGTPATTRSRPSKGLRFISLDTVAEGGGENGNLDDPQYRWLQASWRRRKTQKQLVVVFGHHTLGTMDNTRTDEGAGMCDPADEPGCDRDPRNSTPLHRGPAGPSDPALFTANPNVIAYVTGHTHANRCASAGRQGRGFWQINTASHIDWPEQSRPSSHGQRDGTLSLFGTLLDSAAPPPPPRPGPRALTTTRRSSPRSAARSPQRPAAGRDEGLAAADAGSKRGRARATATWSCSAGPGNRGEEIQPLP